MQALSISSNQKFIHDSCRELQSFDEMVPIIGILYYVIIKHPCITLKIFT